MTLPLWGSLEKATDNAQTIDQAIAAAIAAHEADPEAHLGEGESLSEHKHETTIDHPVGSVLADKKTMTEISIDHDFSSMDFWTVVGSVSNANWPTVGLYLEYGDVNESSIALYPSSPAPWLSYNFGMVFQVEMHTELSGANFHAWLGMGLEDDVPLEGFGFVVQAGVLKAVVASASTPVYSSALAVDISGGHIYRAQMMPQYDVVRFFVDGEQVAELAIPETSPDSDGGPSVGCRLSAAGDGALNISDLHFSRSIIPGV